MTSPEHDPSIQHEPHLKPGGHAPDPSESKVDGRLDAEHARTDPAEERARHSVFDELAILPGRPPVTIDQDWHCRRCGYNLRGLRTGHPCPECGVVERYEPPRADEVTYARWEARHGTAPSWGYSVLVFAASVAVMVPAAAVCSFLLTEQLQVFMFCLIGPVAAEFAKLAPALFVAERRGRVRASSRQILMLAFICALVFALVQSFINLALFHRNAPAELIAYRWTLGPVLHLSCTMIAAWGLIRAQDPEAVPGSFATLTKLRTSLVIAIVVHGAINGVVFVKGYFGYGF